MTAEQAIQADLVTTFPFLAGQVRIARVRRLFATVPAEHFEAVFAHATGKAGFTILCTITGLDEGAKLTALYHLARPSGEMLNLARAVPRERPAITTVSRQFPAADAYERELVDLLGFQVEGLPPGNRYPLPDGWPAGQYPLRKDWKPQDETPAPAVPPEA